MLGKDREHKYSNEKALIGRGKDTDLGSWKINVINMKFLGDFLFLSCNGKEMNGSSLYLTTMFLYCLYKNSKSRLSPLNHQACDNLVRKSWLIELNSWN